MIKAPYIKRIATLIILCLLSACTVPSLSAQSQGSNRGNSKASSPQSSSPSVISVSIDVAGARELAVKNNMTGLKSLPPGIARNLQRGKSMPPGIAKQVMPAGMLAGLPSYPGQEWHVAGKDLILVAIGTLIVDEILRGVFD